MMIDKEKLLEILYKESEKDMEYSLRYPPNYPVNICYNAYSVNAKNIIGRIKNGDFDLSPKPQETCGWEFEDSYGDHQEFYITECGKSQKFSEINILENEYKYCPYCGKVIKHA